MTDLNIMNTYLWASIALCLAVAIAALFVLFASKNRRNEREIEDLAESLAKAYDHCKMRDDEVSDLNYKLSEVEKDRTETGKALEAANEKLRDLKKERDDFEDKYTRTWNGFADFYRKVDAESHQIKLKSKNIDEIKAACAQAQSKYEFDITN